MDPNPIPPPPSPAVVPDVVGTKEGPPPVAPAKPKNWLIISLVIIIILLSLGTAAFFAYQYVQLKQPAAITTFEACEKAPGSMMQTSYPAVCVTRDGKRFPQPLTPEEQQNLLPPNPTADWQIYENTQYGFSLQYPPTWKDITSPTTIKNGNRGFELQTSNNEFVLGTVFTGKADHTNDSNSVANFDLPNNMSLLITYVKCQGPGCDFGTTDAITFRQILSAFKFLGQSPTPTCRPRPACLDATPRCLMPETSDMCPPSTKPASTTYTCPANGYVDCMPGPDAKPECSAAAMAWYTANCPDFKGGAL